MITISVVLSFFITVRKNFHFLLPALFVVLLNEIGKSFEWQVTEGPFSIDFQIGPTASTAGTPNVVPAPGSKEVTKVPTGTVVPQPATTETPVPGAAKVPISVTDSAPVLDTPVPNSNPFGVTVHPGGDVLNGDNE